MRIVTDTKVSSSELKLKDILDLEYLFVNKKTIFKRTVLFQVKNGTANFSDYIDQKVMKEIGKYSEKINMCYQVLAIISDLIQILNVEQDREKRAEHRLRLKDNLKILKQNLYY